jgi:hypothetical protein
MTNRDKERLVLRIEQLMRQTMNDWVPGDELEFRNQLPGSRVPDPRRKLPTPEHVLSEEFTAQEYRDAVQRCLRMETIAHQNRPANMRRLLHHLSRCKVRSFRR